MKKSLFSMLAFMVMCLCVLNSADAQVITYVKPKNKAVSTSQVSAKPNFRIDKSKYDIRENGEMMTYIPKTRRTRAGAAEEVVVTCKFEYDEKLYTPNTISVYNKETALEEYYDYENNFIKVTVPKGTYDFHVSFWRTEPGPTFSDIIKELVVVEKDTTIVFDPAEAKNHIHVSSVDPQGEEWRRPVVKYSEDYTSYEILDEGNTDDIAFTRYIILKDYGNVAMFYGNLGWIEYDAQDDRNEVSDFLINDVSGRYLFCASLLMSSNGTAYIVKLGQEGTENKDMTNTADGYVLYEEDFMPTPLGREVNHSPGVSTVDLFNEVQLSGQKKTMASHKLAGNEPVKIYIDAPKDVSSGNRFNIMVYPEFTDYEQEVTYDYGNGNIRKGIVYSNTIGLPVFVSKDGVEYINKGHDAYGNFAFQMREDGGDILEYPGHPAFSYTEAQKTGIYGNSCPINAFMSQNYIPEFYGWKNSYLSPCYIGRLGEIRMSDCQALQMSLKYNGEEVLTDYSRLDSLMMAWAEEKHPDGRIDLTLTNGNVEVDGIPGCNITKVVYDQSKEDWTAPTLQMLHLKNADGMITDRFDASEDGILEFCGGDFNFHNENQRNFFDCKEQTVKVAYSPYGQDRWEELAVDEVPELYRMPGFGYFYRGSLENVNRESGNRWYDLKITLTDMSGNMQEQTISPAFRIENTTGVSEVRQGGMTLCHDNGRLYVTGVGKAGVTLYTVDGMCVMQVDDAVACPVSVGNLAPGMYVVKATAADGRQVVRKITVR